VLREMARMLQRDDPRLARRLQRDPQHPVRRARTVSVVGFVIALVIWGAASATAAVGLMAGSAAVGIVLGLFATGSGILLRGVTGPGAHPASPRGTRSAR
jgi:hypothetical protein